MKLGEGWIKIFIVYDGYIYFMVYGRLSDKYCEYCNFGSKKISVFVIVVC